MVRRAIADTSVFIGLETGRFDDEIVAGFEWGVSVVTLGELRLGVLNAGDPVTSARRLATYQLAREFEPVPIDELVSDTWALLVARLRAVKRKAPINDSWIAATALAHGVAVVTQDADYEPMTDPQVSELEVVRL
ncbi:type II toxin-antitoxin system VapC family toxin [Nonomuraea sp. NPDC059194]|uniref:type II toxin-antitoxin system VapC family toxin n=1 Tax=Nonomuraea sp. NPDC059194 TaxID=3346764 RepID=UPI0036BCD8D3